MKLKVKFDPQSIKEFFIHHVEKIIFAGMILALLLFVYNAMGRERLSFLPDVLKRMADDADGIIERTEAKSTRTAVDYLGKSNGIKTPIEEKPYEHAALWDPALFDQKPKRGEPPLFPVTDLRASVGHGTVPMNMTTAAGTRHLGSTTQGLRWVALTALVPDVKQREEAMAFFKDRQSPTKEWDQRADLPQVYYYRVERAEAAGEEDNGRQLAWTPLHVRNAMLQTQQYRGNAREPVAERYLLNVRSVMVAFPLPPVTDYAWGPEIAHPPEIPLQRVVSDRDGPMGPMSEGVGPEGAMPRGPEGAVAPRAKDEGAADAPAGGADLPDAPADGAPRRGYGREMPPGREGGMEGGMPPPMPGEGMPPMGEGPRRGEYAGRDGMTEESPVKLFRFLDFTVEPGKRYKYRVKLMLTNPNEGLPSRILENEELSKKKWLETEWSELSNVVSVPHDARILAGPVKPSVWATIEPKGTIGIAFFDVTTGAEQAEEFDVIRGQLLNYFKRPLKSTADIRTRTYAPPPMLEDLEGGSRRREAGRERERERERDRDRDRKKPPVAEPEPTETVDYLTDAVLLDMFGGNKLPGRDREATEPGRILVLDRDGTLVMLDELDDAEDFKAILTPEPTRPNRGLEMPMGEGMPPGMMMPGEGNLGELMGATGRKPARGKPAGKPVGKAGR